jgi:hypothetical protein
MHVWLMGLQLKVCISYTRMSRGTHQEVHATGLLYAMCIYRIKDHPYITKMLEEKKLYKLYKGQ